MLCEDVQGELETLGDGATPEPAVSAHLAACRRCSASFALARQIHLALEAQPTASPPPGFVSAVIGRTHSLSWQSEQRFDWWFNAVMAASVAIILLGIWGLMNVTGLAAVTVGTADFVGRSVPALYEQIKPQLRLYLTAATLVAGGLVVWWWLERGGRPQRAA